MPMSQHKVSIRHTLYVSFFNSNSLKNVP